MSAVLVLLLTIFMLLQYRDLRDRMVRLMGTAEMGRSTQAFDEASANLAHYLLLQSAVNATFGAFVALSLWAIGIPSPILWGALTAVLRFVPFAPCGRLPDGTCRDDRSDGGSWRKPQRLHRR
jgi:predicted PurR-regulated permease PerM